MLIEIRQQPFDPWQELSNYQENAGLVPGSYGACATFVGTMRDFNQGSDIKQMKLEHYEGMTQHQLGEIANQAVSDYKLLDLLIIHRVGEINPNDSIVLVASWSAHRAAAFDSCRAMMEHLKSKATFWKKEVLVAKAEENGGDLTEQTQERWVEQIKSEAP